MLQRKHYTGNLQSERCWLHAATSHGFGPSKPCRFGRKLALLLLRVGSFDTWSSIIHNCSLNSGNQNARLEFPSFCLEQIAFIHVLFSGSGQIFFRPTSLRAFAMMPRRRRRLRMAWKILPGGGAARSGNGPLGHRDRVDPSHWQMIATFAWKIGHFTIFYLCNYPVFLHVWGVGSIPERGVVHNNWTIRNALRLQWGSVVFHGCFFMNQLVFQAFSCKDL